MIKPLNFEHRIVLVINVMSGVATALFVSDAEVAFMMRRAAEEGAKIAGGDGSKAVLAMVCPEDVITMRENTPPSDLRETHLEMLERVERLIEENINVARPALAARAPS